MEDFGSVYFKWQINDKETCALILKQITSEPQKVIYITSKEDVETLTHLISCKNFKWWQVRIYDEDGHETQRYDPEQATCFEDFEVKLGENDPVDADLKAAKKLIKQFDENKKHQARLARRREAYRRKMWRKRNPNKIKFFKTNKEES